MDGMSLRNERPLVRGFLALWLLLWTTFGAFGLGNVFYQYFSNIRALRDGACVISEGPISRFHPDSLRGHGDHESFIVGGREFRYSYFNLGGGGLHYTGDLKLQLYDGLYVKIWSRNGIICRFDARPIQMKPQPGT